MKPIDLALGHVRVAAGDAPGVRTSGREYGPAAGDLALREAVARWENVTREEVAITTGASLALVATLATLPRPGSVLCPRPYYPAYPAIASMMGLNVTFYDLEPNLAWQPAPEAVSRRIRPDTRAMFWNFPANPTGCLPCATLVDEIREVSRRHDLLIISDEVYADFNYSGVELPCARATFGSEHVVRVRSFSKTFGIPGERLGYVVADPDRVSMISRAHWALAMCPPASSQAVGLQVLGVGAASRLRRLKQTLTKNRDRVSRILAGCGAIRFQIPESGIFYWIEVSQCSIGSDTLAQACAATVGVAVMPGVTFGLQSPVFIRASFALPEEETSLGFEALARFLTSFAGADKAYG